MLIYIAGPYTGDRDKNIQDARKVSIELWKKGHAVVCPHLNTAKMEDDGIEYDVILRGDVDIISRCDAIMMMENWEESSGASLEHKYAEGIGLPIFYWPVIPERHPTEIRCPDQCEAFREVTNQMYRLHLQKNQDYSPANIKGPGVVGLAVRLWDKTTRMMSLLGFEIDISDSKYVGPKEARNETLDDTFIDLSNYGVIGQILRKGRWGK